MKKTARVLAAVMAFLVLGRISPGQTDEERLRALEQELTRLRTAVAAAREAGTLESRLEELERRLGVLAEEVDRLRRSESEASADASQMGLGPAASKVYRSGPGVSFGGYGEALYEDPASTRDDGTASARNEQADLLRVVLYTGYAFSDRFVLNTEIEFEHASTGKGGEVSIELATIDFLARPEVGVRGGMVLMPVGLVNELHEPTVFLGSRRPQVESVLIPTTWREFGVGLFGELGDFTYRTYVVTGLDAGKFSAGGIRAGRQSGARAKATDLAWVGRLDWNGIPGLLLGGSAYIGRSGQGLIAQGSELEVPIVMLEAHLDWRWRGLRLRGLAVRSELDDVAQLNAALGLQGSSSVGEKQSGQYLEVGYDVLAGGGGRRSVVPFMRIERLDTQAGVPPGFAARPDSQVDVRTYGISFKPFEQIVVKADFQDFDTPTGSGVDQFNVALGWIF
ncbi:MAG: hypothetical protein ACOY3Y_09155 [Acidobacteriota bacterium]